VLNIDTHTSDFFVAGGTLPPDSPSHVERPADKQLFNSALFGRFCYVFGPQHWEWTGNLPQGLGFEVRVWAEGEPPAGCTMRCLITKTATSET
jgi:hypothetical protein